MIRAAHLSRSWGTFALEDICLEAGAREYVVIVGPCGSGKTLLLETIAGLYSCQAGTIHIGDREVTHLPPEKRRISLVYQQYALFPHLTVEENIAYGLRYTGLNRSERRERVRDMVSLFDIETLSGRANPNELSGGEGQKVALARALATHPDALLLDEPLSSLDPPAREKVMDLLARLPEQMNIPILHVTHDYSEATALADRVAVMSEGRVVQYGTVREVFHHPDSEFVARFVGVENRLEASRADEAGTYAVADGFLHPDAGSSPLPRKALLCIRPEDVQLIPEAAGITDGFRATVQEARREGFSVRVILDTPCGKLVALTSENQVRHMALTVGSACGVVFPPECLHIIPLEEP